MTAARLWGNHTMSTEEDSADLTDEEVKRAVETTGSNQLAQLLLRALAGGSRSVGESGRYTVARHEIRRRQPHLYLRSFLVGADKTEVVLLHRVDWLEDGASAIGMSNVGP